MNGTNLCTVVLQYNITFSWTLGKSKTPLSTCRLPLDGNLIKSC